MAQELQPPTLDPHHLALIRMAVREDMGHGSYGTLQGDLTAQLAIPAEYTATAKIIARKPGVISGTFLIDTILREYQVGMSHTILIPDGGSVQRGDIVATLTGGTRSLLSAERVILNFLGHLSGIATLTHAYVQAVSGTIAKICDTRKTAPAFRILDKYAVRCGGGTNHRLGLYDGVMLKDNHLAALRDKLGHAGGGVSIAQLTKQVRSTLDKKIPLWLEVDTLDQLADELHGAGGGADIILLDNMDAPKIKKAVDLRNSASKKPLLEASGGITLANIREIAETGVDRISIGALTHSAPVLDLSMEL